ncbi:MAG: ATP-binding cassette domain-containing protein, partial [Kiritimatiellae bacterium]|nr:ATP-binding cassette domain-containing protein [Kiritimatiellia bacterium]
MLEVRNIAFSYVKKTILKDVSFSVAQGERIAIVGSNGSGKTTLIKLLATLAVPDSGTISFDNQEALSRSLRYRRMVGYLPERIALYDDMTVKAYLAYRAALKGEAGRR